MPYRSSGLVGRAGLEPATGRLRVRCSDQLSYRPIPAARVPHSRPAHRYVRRCPSVPVTGPVQRPADLPGDELRVLPDKPRREPQRPVAIDVEVVVPLHVVPALQGILGVLGAVDLSHDLAGVPQDVGPPPSPRESRRATWRI